MSDLDTQKWLKRIGEDPNAQGKFSSTTSLTQGQWDKIRDWVNERLLEISTAPSIEACALLARLDGISPCSPTVLQGSSVFMAAWRSNRPNAK